MTGFHKRVAFDLLSTLPNRVDEVEPDDVTGAAVAHALLAMLPHLETLAAIAEQQKLANLIAVYSMRPLLDHSNVIDWALVEAMILSRLPSVMPEGARL